VVHHRDADLTLAQAEIALSLGAKGVFLIAHGASDGELVPLAVRLTAAHPDRLIGINCLGMTALEALAVCIAQRIKALWTDIPEISSAGVTAAGQALGDRAQAAGIEVFASVAFKYQRAEPDPAEAARLAAVVGTVPTTSGSGTGSAPSVAKIQRMRDALNSGTRLAIASGMDPQNVGDFQPWATDFLVATGVSQDAHHFDPTKLAAFIQRVQA
jgi:predicted TIM-barrel enzyme